MLLIKNHLTTLEQLSTFILAFFENVSAVALYWLLPEFFGDPKVLSVRKSADTNMRLKEALRRAQDALCVWTNFPSKDVLNDATHNASCARLYTRVA